MKISFDPLKNAWNIRERGVAFDAVREFDFENALVRVDERCDYGETRYVALGELRARLHVVCFTETPDGIRVISLRKANNREVRRHAEVQATDER